MTAPHLVSRHSRRLPALVAAIALGSSLILSACGGSDDKGGPAATSTDAPAGKSTTRMITNAGHKLAFHVIAGRLPAIVLDAGGGLDSSQWKDIAPALAKSTGSMVISYDRAGMGASEAVPGAFKVQDAAADLEAGLRALKVKKDVVFVGHSLAGEVGTTFVRRYPGVVSGAVLLDASLPTFYTPETTAALVKATEPQVAELKKKGDKATKADRQLIALSENYGPDHLAYHQVTWPDDIPVTVVLAQETPFTDAPPVAELWRTAQKQFADAAPNRRLVVAKSPHDIPTDHPELVIKEVEDMVTLVKK